jgi:cold shock CspA family protein
MAKYDHGGGCSCGLQKVCNCGSDYTDLKVQKVDTKTSAYERIQAPVKFYSKERGYGFFKRPDKPDAMDIFFTNKTLERAGHTNAKENEVFEFDLVPVEGKGGKAINIKKINK